MWMWPVGDGAKRTVTVMAPELAPETENGNRKVLSVRTILPCMIGTRHQGEDDNKDEAIKTHSHDLDIKRYTNID